jgi:hypothetical protein
MAGNEQVYMEKFMHQQQDQFGMINLRPKSTNSSPQTITTAKLAKAFITCLNISTGCEPSETMCVRS